LAAGFEELLTEWQRRFQDERIQAWHENNEQRSLLERLLSTLPPDHPDKSVPQQKPSEE
jgi:hypothetical protein